MSYLPFTAATGPEADLKHYRYDLGVLLSLAVLLFGLSVGTVRFVRDDIANIYNFWDMIHSETVAKSLSSIASNAWLGLRRSFFFTWWIQYGLLRLSNLSDPLQSATTFYCFIFAVHFANSALIYWLARRALVDRMSALAMAAIYLSLPHAVETYFVANNWFFILPLFFYLLFWWLWMILQPLTVSSVILQSGALLLSMFSGEQLLALPFAVGLVQAVQLLAEKKTGWKTSLIHAVTVYGLTGFAYIIYLTVVSISPPNDPLSQPLSHYLSSNTVAIIGRYNDQLYYQIKSIFDPASWVYGEGSIGASPLATVLGIASGVMFFVYLQAISVTRTGPRILWAVTYWIAAVLAVLMPMYTAAILGVRPGPDTRYLLSPTLLIVALLILMLLPLGRLIRSIAYSTLLSSCIFLTSLLLLDVWPTQAAIDRRLWQALEASIGPETDYVLTLNNSPEANYLMPPWQSIAWSDFQADWAIQSRFRHIFGRSIEMIRRADLTGENSVLVEGYYGSKHTSVIDRISVIYFDSGRTLGQTLNGKIEIMTYRNYLAHREQLQIPEKRPN